MWVTSRPSTEPGIAVPGRQSCSNISSLTNCRAKPHSSKHGGIDHGAPERHRSNTAIGSVLSSAGQQDHHEFGCSVGNSVASSALIRNTSRSHCRAVVAASMKTGLQGSEGVRSSAKVGLPRTQQPLRQQVKRSETHNLEPPLEHMERARELKRSGMLHRGQSEWLQVVNLLQKKPFRCESKMLAELRVHLDAITFGLVLDPGHTTDTLSVYCHNLLAKGQYFKDGNLPFKLVETAVHIVMSGRSIVHLQELQQRPCIELVLWLLRYLQPEGNWKVKMPRHEGGMLLATYWKDSCLKSGEDIESDVLRQVASNLSFIIDGEQLYPRPPVYVKLGLPTAAGIKQIISVNVHLRCKGNRAVKDMSISGVLDAMSLLSRQHKCDVLLGGDVNLDPYKHREIIHDKGADVFEGVGATNMKGDKIYDAYILMQHKSSSDQGPTFWDKYRVTVLEPEGRTESYEGQYDTLPAYDHKIIGLRKQE